MDFRRQRNHYEGVTPSSDQDTQPLPLPPSLPRPDAFATPPTQPLADHSILEGTTNELQGATPRERDLEARLLPACTHLLQRVNRELREENEMLKAELAKSRRTTRGADHDVSFSEEQVDRH